MWSKRPSDWNVRPTTMVLRTSQSVSWFIKPAVSKLQDRSVSSLQTRQHIWQSDDLGGPWTNRWFGFYWLFSRSSFQAVIITQTGIQGGSQTMMWFLYFTFLKWFHSSLDGPPGRLVGELTPSIEFCLARGHFNTLPSWESNRWPVLPTDLQLLYTEAEKMRRRASFSPCRCWSIQVLPRVTQLPIMHLEANSFIDWFPAETVL